MLARDLRFFGFAPVTRAGDAVTLSYGFCLIGDAADDVWAFHG